MLFRCCLVPISIIIMRHFICFLSLCLCLDLGLFMSYLCDLFFFFFSIFIMINRIMSWIQTHLFFCLFFRVIPFIFGCLRGGRMWIIFKKQMFSLRVLLSICLNFANFSQALLVKVLLIKKACNRKLHFLRGLAFFLSSYLTIRTLFEKSVRAL